MFSIQIEKKISRILLSFHIIMHSQHDYDGISMFKTPKWVQYAHIQMQISWLFQTQKE